MRRSCRGYPTTATAERAALRSRRVDVCASGLIPEHWPKSEVVHGCGVDRVQARRIASTRSHVALVSFADLLRDVYGGSILRMDQRDEPLTAELAEGPITNGECSLRRVTLPPIQARQYPSDLDLGGRPDLRARTCAPVRRVPGLQPRSPNDDPVVMALQHECPEPILLPKPAIPSDRVQ